jgi:hypothetical protein
VSSCISYSICLSFYFCKARQKLPGLPNGMRTKERPGSFPGFSHCILFIYLSYRSFYMGGNISTLTGGWSKKERKVDSTHVPLEAWAFRCIQEMQLQDREVEQSSSHHPNHYSLPEENLSLLLIFVDCALRQEAFLSQGNPLLLLGNS